MIDWLNDEVVCVSALVISIDSLIVWLIDRLIGISIGIDFWLASHEVFCVQSSSISIDRLIDD